MFKYNTELIYCIFELGVKTKLRGRTLVVLNHARTFSGVNE